VRRGEPEAAFESSDVRLDVTYVTPNENHNPLEPSVTVAQWRDGVLTVHDSTQWCSARAPCSRAASICPRRRCT